MEEKEIWSAHFYWQAIIYGQVANVDISWCLLESFFFFNSRLYKAQTND